MTENEREVMVLQALVLFLKMSRKYAYATGRVEEGFGTIYLELLAKRIIGMKQAHIEILHYYGVE